MTRKSIRIKMHGSILEDKPFSNNKYLTNQFGNPDSFDVLSAEPITGTTPSIRKYIFNCSLDIMYFKNILLDGDYKDTKLLCLQRMIYDL